MVNKISRQDSLESLRTREWGCCELWVISHAMAWLNAWYPDLYYFLYFVWLASPCSFLPLISQHALQQGQIGSLCMVEHLKRWCKIKWLSIADKMKWFWENELRVFLFLPFFFLLEQDLAANLSDVVLQMSNLISIHNSKTELSRGI